MKAGDILDDARIKISDTDKTRWSDSQLLSILFKGCMDLAQTTDLFKSVGYVPLGNNVLNYNYSDNILIIDRVEHLNKVLPLYTQEDMDSRYGFGWQEKTGKLPESIIYANKISGVFRVYPIINDVNKIPVKSNSPYGLVMNIDRKENVKFNIVGTFGVIKSSEIQKYLKVYYKKIPKKAAQITDDLDYEITKTVRLALSHFIAYDALLNNTDAQNHRLAQTELHFYNQIKLNFSRHTAVNNTDKQRKTEYNGMG